MHANTHETRHNVTDDMTPFEELLKQPPPEPPMNPISCLLVWIGLLILSIFCLIGAGVTIAWVLS